MNHEKLVAKKIYAIRLGLLTPMNIGGSEDENTDHDLIRDGEGKFFLPGTSIAGAIFGYCKKNRDVFSLLLQSTDCETMSKVIISDGCFSEVTEAIRDGVALDMDHGEKTALDKSKYDYEVAEKDGSFEFSIELTLRTRDIEDDIHKTLVGYDDEIKKILWAMDEQLIRFGYKKNRGYGCVKVESSSCQEFYGDTLKDFLKRDAVPFVPFDFPHVDDFSSYHVIQVDELSLLSGISIRSYSTLCFKADHSHIQSNGTPAISGTSWAGLLRSQMNAIAKSLGYQGYRHDTIFGSIGEDSEALRSKILFMESYLKGGIDMDSTRTAIDDVTGSALNAHLFTENVHYQGKTSLKILLEKSVDDKVETKASVALLVLALYDLENGLCAIGGATSIGRGILLGDSISFDGNKVSKDDTHALILKPYFEALCEKIKEEQ